VDFTAPLTKSPFDKKQLYTFSVGVFGNPPSAAETQESGH
jgi:hypothetical protein